MQSNRKYKCNTDKMDAATAVKGEDMAKIMKTYRLSEMAVHVIDSRDTIKYPTANEFVESAIIAADGDHLADPEMAALLNEIRKLCREIIELKQMLEGAGRNREYGSTTEGKSGMKSDYPLPEI